MDFPISVYLEKGRDFNVHFSFHYKQNLHFLLYLYYKLPTIITEFEIYMFLTPPTDS